MLRDVNADTDVSSLPIMTFGNSSLTPAFGYVFNRQWIDPYESIVSILWKFAQMNALSGQAIALQLSRPGIDPYKGVAASRMEVDMRRLRDALRVPLKLVRSALIPDWLKDCSSTNFRFCTKCLRRGYHGVVHQMKSVDKCPIHGETLRVACPCCSHSTPYILNARLLNAPFRCPDCRAYFGLSKPRFLKRRPLTLRERVAITRLKLNFYSS